MTKLTTERLEYYAALPTQPAEGDGFFKKGIFMYEVRRMARQLLAYEQAGKETKIYQYQSCLFNDENGETDWYWDDCDKGFFEQYDPAHRRIVYTAPVLPKQPVKPVMFIDGDISSDDAEKLAAVIREFGNEPAPAQPVIPEQNDLSEKLIGLANHIASAANGIPFGWQDWADEIVTDLRSLASTAQPVSEPYKLPELNDELIEILGRPNFTCTKLAECLRHCGQDIKRKSENEQAAVLHVLLNLYIKHGNDWRKHAEEAFTPAPAQESE